MFTCQREGVYNMSKIESKCQTRWWVYKGVALTDTMIRLEYLALTRPAVTRASGPQLVTAKKSQKAPFSC